MKYALILVAVGTMACSGERLTGPAAQDAVKKYGHVEVAESNAPIVFLDGKEMTFVGRRSLDSIDANTIESVQVFKGKAALEAYGARAKNGVVVIERKAEFRSGR